ncbi:uracil-DNA glycosylase [uncultured Kocuria sp.]|uniref:uracil-DNA glycosylase n=1 Tax=uncultured Kocuria sp. TaxID=259305 RepID=UPI002599A919|nr:uracil-DNA glycosylase [uncultured Kocuria sp.]MCT1366397.1 uracil-DNA glycosylase [Rothia sp. p3-SID1597]
MTVKPLEEIMAADWADALKPVEPTIRTMGQFLREEHKNGFHTLPAAENIFRAFQEPLSSVRVLIIGQDPYPTPGHAMGLSFSVQDDVRPLPRSLTNIYRELRSDLGVEPPEHGDLSRWSRQGIMLLNRCLTVRAGEAGSHRNRGWELVTDAAIQALASRNQPLVAILWGRDARNAGAQLGPAIPKIESVHPSPLSASRGFFGSRPFSRANEALASLGESPVDWNLG